MCTHCGTPGVRDPRVVQWTQQTTTVGVLCSCCPPSCSMAVQWRCWTVSTSAVTHSRRRFFSSEGELTHTCVCEHAHIHTALSVPGGSTCWSS